MKKLFARESNQWRCLLVAVGSILVFIQCMSHVGFAASPPSVTLTPDENDIQRVTIIMESYSFSPNNITIQADKPLSIQLENQSFLIPHNFVIDNASMGLHHEFEISAGDSLNMQLLLSTPGTYTFYCDKQLLFFPKHRDEGMEGTLIVQ